MSSKGWESSTTFSTNFAARMLSQVSNFSKIPASGADDEAVGSECLLDLGDQFEVWDGRPGVRGARRRDTLNVPASDGACAAMEHEVRARTFGNGGRRLLIEKCDHEVVSFLF